MTLRTYATDSGGTVRGPDFASHEDAWGYLLALHRRRLDAAAKIADDSIIRQMRTKKRYESTGSVTGKDPLNDKQSITYGVSSW